MSCSLGVVGSHFGRRRPLAFEPGANAVVSQLRPVAHQGAIRLAIGSSAGRIHLELDHNGGAVFIFVERRNPFGELGRQHGKNLHARVNRGGFTAGVAVDHCAFGHASVHVGHAHEYATAPIGQLFRPLDLVEILGCVVVDRGPQQAAQVLKFRRTALR